MTTSGPDTGPRLGRALLAYMVIVTLVITLVPFRIVWPSHFELSLSLHPLDAIANLVLFLPLGFLYQLTRSTGRPSPAIRALGLGLAFSALIEGAQLLDPERIASVSDIVSNGAGAWVGALLHNGMAFKVRRNAAFIGRLTFELPLMGLLYLLIPLLWLDTLGATETATGAWLTLLLGLVGALALGAVHRYRFAPAEVLTAAETALLGAGWFIIGTYPSFGFHPLPAFVSLAVVVLTVTLRGARGEYSFSSSRRFENAVIRQTLPLFLVYLLLLAVWPPTRTLASWSLAVGFDRSMRGADTIHILRLLEYVAAFTVLGYMIAELRGRHEESYRVTMRWILAACLPTALGLELLRAVHPSHGASVLTFATTIGASLYGGSLYHLLREHVQRIREMESGNEPVAAA